VPQLTVNNEVFQYPSPGDEPGWGEGATAWAVAVTDVLNTLLGPGDILNTTFSVANNQTSVTNVTGCIFDSTIVRAANVSYSIYRKTDSFTSGNTEAGTLLITYDNAAALGSKWTLVQNASGSAGVSFSINDSGQVQYISTDLTGANHLCTMKFSAKTLAQ
jgi:hypothetical protein